MIKEDVMKALNEIRPQLQADGGDVNLVDVMEDGTVKVSLVGACGHCPMAQITLSQGIERRVKELVPEVKKVVAV